MENLAPITLTEDIPTKAYVDARAINTTFYAYSGRWGIPWPSPKISQVFSIPAKWMYAYRVISQSSIQSVAVEVAVANASGTFRVAIYSDSPPWPGTLGSNVNLTTTSIGLKTAAVSRAPGAFWLAIHNTGTVAISMRANMGVNPYTPGSIDTTGASAMASGIGYNVNSATTPATWPAGTGTDASGIMFALRAT